MSNNAHPRTGKVYLAGAGPGDPELITLKLLRVLGDADVILTDRLVNPLIIDKHAREDCLILQAGKQGYSDHSNSQASINQLLVEHAKAGKIVLRLKGGDVAFFSNVLDELQAIEGENIPFEIIPGITAASGASAYAGIPLTAREHAQGVQWITFNPNSYYPPVKWKELAQSEDTLVFYMAARNLEQLAHTLLEHGANPMLPMAIIEQATTPFQRVYRSTLQSCRTDYSGKTFCSPSLVIIGKVTELHERFNWFPTDPNAGTVFPSLQRREGGW